MMEYEETDFTPPATNVHKVVRAKSKKKKKVQNEETSVISEVVGGLYSDIAQSAMDKLKSKDFGKEGDTDKDKKLSQEEERAQRKATRDQKKDEAQQKRDAAKKEREDRLRRRQGDKDAQDAMDRGETEVQQTQSGDAIIGSEKPETEGEAGALGVMDALKDILPDNTKPGGFGPSSPASTAPGAVAGETKDIADTSPDMPNAQDASEDTRDDISPSKKESVFYVASVLREDDEDYSDDEISRDKDPDAAGGPYSEDDIKVTQDPRDAAPGMDPVADPPTQQAKQITTGMAYKAPAAAGTMQTMLPGGEHDAIQKQYPDLIENLLGCGGDMKGGFLADPKDKKKAMAAMALMSSLDKKLKEDKKTRLKKILNTTKPPAIPGSEGY
jgi:hypothetical protein